MPDRLRRQALQPGGQVVVEALSDSAVGADPQATVCRQLGLLELGQQLGLGPSGQASPDTLAAVVRTIEMLADQRPVQPCGT